MGEVSRLSALLEALEYFGMRWSHFFTFVICFNKLCADSCKETKALHKNLEERSVAEAALMHTLYRKKQIHKMYATTRMCKYLQTSPETWPKVVAGLCLARQAETSWRGVHNTVSPLGCSTIIFAAGHHLYRLRMRWDGQFGSRV